MLKTVPDYNVSMPKEKNSPKLRPHICKIVDRAGRYDSVVGMFAQQVSVSCSRVVEP